MDGYLFFSFLCFVFACWLYCDRKNLDLPHWKELLAPIGTRDTDTKLTVNIYMPPDQHINLAVAMNTEISDNAMSFDNLKVDMAIGSCSITLTFYLPEEKKPQTNKNTFVFFPLKIARCRTTARTFSAVAVAFMRMRARAGPRTMKAHTKSVAASAAKTNAISMAPARRAGCFSV